MKNKLNKLNKLNRVSGCSLYVFVLIVTCCFIIPCLTVLTSCTEDRAGNKIIGISTVDTSEAVFKITKLFTKDGNTVYRFYDSGNVRYFWISNDSIKKP